jgi:hypothetical protein
VPPLLGAITSRNVILLGQTSSRDQALYVFVSVCSEGNKSEPIGILVGDQCNTLVQSISGVDGAAAAIHVAAPHFSGAARVRPPLQDVGTAAAATGGSSRRERPPLT